MTLIEQINSAKLVKYEDDLLILIIDDKEVGIYDYDRFYREKTSYHGSDSSVASFINKKIMMTINPKYPRERDTKKFNPYWLSKFWEYTAINEASTFFLKTAPVGQSFLVKDYLDYIDEQRKKFVAKNFEELTKKKTFWQRLWGK